MEPQGKAGFSLGLDVGLLASPWRVLRESASLRRASVRGPEGIFAAQQARLRTVVEHAREASPFYREAYAALPRDWRLDDLPLVRKPELMARFDAWVTRPEVTLARAEAHVADEDAVGARLDGRYAVVTTSGVTGRRGVFVHDRDAVAAYTALVLARAVPSWASAEARAIARRGLRVASVVATGGHFAAAAMGRMVRESVPGGAGRMRVFSVMQDLPSLAAALEAYDPTVLFGYPSAMAMLAAERVAGRLRLAPRLVLAGGECLGAAERARIVEAFGCTVRDVYAASEFPLLAAECAAGRLHWNADRVVVEAVDARGRPVAPGSRGETTLITNLVNRVQPLVRYDLGDATTLLPDACPCGSPLPTLRVEGRRDDTLRFPGRAGGDVPILPLALGTLIEETPGVERFQAYQTAEDVLRVRLLAQGDPDAVWARVAQRLAAWLAQQGAAPVRLEHDPEPPQRDARTGKHRQVWRAGGPPPG